VPAERRQPSVPQQTLARIRLLEPLAKECARLKKLVKQALQQGAEVEAGALSAQLEHEEKQYLRWQFMAAQLRLSSEQVKAMRAASPITVRCRLLIRPVTNHCTSSEHYDGHTIHEDDTFEDDDFFDDDDSDEDSD